MGDEWKSFLDGCISNYPKSFYALALGYSDDDNLGTLFSATNGTDEDWTPFYADPHKVQIEGKDATMDETAHLAKIIRGIEASDKYPMFLYLGAQKYQITRADTEDSGDNKFVTVMFAISGRGGAIVKGPKYFCIGLYDEKKEQNKASCRTDLFKVCEQCNAY